MNPYPYNEKHGLTSLSVSDMKKIPGAAFINMASVTKACKALFLITNSYGELL